MHFTLCIWYPDRLHRGGDAAVLGMDHTLLYRFSLVCFKELQLFLCLHLLKLPSTLIKKHYYELWHFFLQPH